MPAPALTDYEYQFKDTGFKLNGTSALPFVDVARVEGLGMADFEAHIDDFDGTHGSAINVRYAKGRIVVIEGTLYASPSTIQTTIDTITANFLPDDIEYPFYFKQPGISQRYVNAKALACKFEEDALRRIGASPIQIQLGVPSPEKRIENAEYNGSFASFISAPNNGNAHAYAKYTITGAWTAMKFAYTQNNNGVVVTLATPAIAGDVVVIDFKTRTVTKNGINITGQVTLSEGTWWSILPNTNAAVTAEQRTGTPTNINVKTYSAWL